jgi:hypothetical protein
MRKGTGADLLSVCCMHCYRGPPASPRVPRPGAVLGTSPRARRANARCPRGPRPTGPDRRCSRSRRSAPETARRRWPRLSRTAAAPKRWRGRRASTPRLDPQPFQAVVRLLLDARGREPVADPALRGIVPDPDRTWWRSRHRAGRGSPDQRLRMPEAVGRPGLDPAYSRGQARGSIVATDSASSCAPQP